MIEERQ